MTSKKKSKKSGDSIVVLPVPERNSGPGQEIVSTPENENERVLVEHQGGVVEMFISDRSADGRFVKIGGEFNIHQWQPTKNVKILHRLESSKK